MVVDGSHPRSVSHPETLLHNDRGPADNAMQTVRGDRAEREPITGPEGRPKLDRPVGLRFGESGTHQATPMQDRRTVTRRTT